MTLYEIDKALMDFEFEIDEETGEILNAADLDELKMAREQKIEGVGLWIKNLEAEKEAVKNEKNNLDAREKRIAKKIDGLKDYLAYALDGQPFSTSRLVVGWRKSESVDISNEALIPAEYCNIATVSKPDKKAIKKALKEGKEIMGATIVENNNIQIS